MDDQAKHAEATTSPHSIPPHTGASEVSSSPASNLPTQPSVDLELLSEVEKLSTPKEIAEFLHRMPRSDPKMVGRILGEPDAKSLSVLYEYANLFKFEDTAFDIALRVYLGQFELPTEAQKIDRILQAFAKAYHKSNPNSIECPSEDAVYTLAFSVLLLNTDAHNPRLSRKFKMTRADFIRNYHQLGAGGNSSTRPGVPSAYLGQCYDLFATEAIQRIERKPIELLPDELELEFQELALGLEIETSFDGRTAIVKRYANSRHTHHNRRRSQSRGASSKTSGSSFFTSGANMLATGSSILANILATLDPEPDISITGWVIVAVGEDCTRQIGYALTRYLLKTAPRPVVIRFCEPSIYFASLV
ncbi:hypothetical protein PsorP6_000329 [Peronosclerospora sorghi]|uniref:Uncharacterized protein n=1 Tax=Peronosclerospora sorghi TaxID=230839 RepID=A0ACC0WSU9_9STRA|nr:hypothetical protein PsorP6_000329 [Peronosclerospora sorghi]